MAVDNFLGLDNYGWAPGWSQEPQAQIDSGSNWWGVVNDITDLLGPAMGGYFALEQAKIAGADQTPVSGVQQPVGQNAALNAGMMQDNGTIKMIGFALVGVAILSIVTSGKKK